MACPAIISRCLPLPITAELLPGGNLGVTALMIAIVVPFYNMMSVVVLEYFRGGKPKLGEVLLAVQERMKERKGLKA